MKQDNSKKTETCRTNKGTPERHSETRKVTAKKTEDRMNTVNRINQLELGIRSCLLVLVLLTFCQTAYSDTGTTWVPSKPGQEMGAALSNVVTSDDKELVMDLEFPGFRSSDVTRNGTNFQILEVLQCGIATEIGKPALPVMGQLIAIPVGAVAEVVVISSQYTELDGYYVHPAQEPLTDGGQGEAPKFEMDESFYQQQGFYPETIAILETPGVIRGLNVTHLRVYPVQFNPATRTLRVYSNIQVRITFSGGGETFFDAEHYSPHFNGMYDLAINREALEVPPPPPTESKGANGCEYLIITHPNFFLGAANTLAEWKNLTGIDTEVRTTTQISGSSGVTTAQIKDYIQNAYDNWNPSPSFVLLIGDAEFIPTNYVTVHNYHNFLTGTDLYYSTVDGPDYFPDISMGRISVDNVADANKRISDIVSYERNPIPDAGFYSSVATCAYFQDGLYPDNPSHPDHIPPDGFADRRFAMTSEDIRGHLLTEGYAVDRIYYTEQSVNPTNWCNEEWIFGGGPAGYRGDTLPTDLQKSTFPWNGDAGDISATVNAGRFLVTHRDHGLRTAWGEPYYSTTNVDALNNGNKLPVVWSINCQTGWFDNETDPDTALTTYDSECFAESWERNPNGGAIGVIAATRVSYSNHNDRLAWGWMDAIWPNFNTAYAGGAPFAHPQFRMGQVLNYGKMYYSTIYTQHSIYRLTEFEVFHWFGDPTMRIWTAYPSNLAVNHDTSYISGTTSFVVSVTQANCLISLVMNGEILGTAVSYGGNTTVHLNSPLPLLGTLYITVTGSNYHPYEGTAISGGPGPPCCTHTGDVDYDGQAYTVADIVQLVRAFADKDSTLLPCIGNADINGDCVIDVDDKDYLINIVTLGWPHVQHCGSCTAYTVNFECILTGDVDGDNNPWMIADAVLLARVFAEQDSTLLPRVGNADVNGDCHVDGDDLAYLVGVIYGDSTETDFCPGCNNYTVCTDPSGNCDCRDTRGNVNGDPSDLCNIADLTYLVAYLFGGGPAPTYPEEANVNGDPAEAVNIADLTYLVAYLFGGGPAPYDCGVYSSAPPAKLSRETKLDATYEDGQTTVSIESPVDFRGLQIELVGNSSANPVSLVKGGLEMVYHYDNNNLTLGLLDLNGSEVITSGSHPLFTIEGDFDIESALISDLDHHEVVPVIRAERNVTRPNKFALSQNYPNPFNPTTTICFSLGEKSDYQLTLYNVTGQIVRTFEGSGEAGEQSVVWDASRNSSGVYFYKLEAGNFSATKKMVLLK